MLFRSPPPTPRPNHTWIRGQLFNNRECSGRPVGYCTPAEWKQGPAARKEYQRQAPEFLPLVHAARSQRTIPRVPVEGEEIGRFNFHYGRASYPLHNDSSDAESLPGLISDESDQDVSSGGDSSDTDTAPNFEEILMASRLQAARRRQRRRQSQKIGRAHV